MNNKYKIIRIVFILFLIALNSVFAQKKTLQTKVDKNGFTYKFVNDDPLGVKMYQLKNGLKVYLSVNKTSPRIFGYIAVKTGSANDPSLATGLAHYLEHMLFKGTDSLGSLNFAKEQPLLKKIEDLYQVYRKTKDVNKRKQIYHQIDSISGVAAQYVAANEYDKLTSALGSKSTNAYTATDKTVYRNDIPSNQLEKWLKLESERFRNPQMRIFHTELEAVYEEKNISLDNDIRQAMEKMQEALFQNHSYGTQTAIGTINHLKNPSITEIIKYYNKYYVPNNMAVILSGDLDPEKTIQLVDKYFGKMQSKKVEPRKFSPEKSKGKPTVKEVFGPQAEMIMMAYRFPGANSKDAKIMMLLDMMLYNEFSGLFDLNLNLKQKVLVAQSAPILMKDYSYQRLIGVPREGQTLEEVRDLLLGQLDKLKKGDFDEEIIKASIRNFEAMDVKNFEKNQNRADAMLDDFVYGYSWENVVSQYDELKKLTKDDIVKAANKYYTNDYVIVYKRKGKKNSVKVEKPEITPVKLNNGDLSIFAKSVLKMESSDIQPKFVDYKTAITKKNIKPNLPLLYHKNDENKRFALYYYFDFGSKTDEIAGLAADYLQYLGTEKMTSAQLKQKQYNLACELGVEVQENNIYVFARGLQDQFDDAVMLLEEWINEAKADDAVLKNFIQDKIKDRNIAKTNKQFILQEALRNYAIYGPNNPFRNQLSEKELNALEAKTLVDKIKSLPTYEHRILYYGPESINEVSKKIKQFHKIPTKLNPVPKAKNYVRLDTKENMIYFVDFDMVQAEILFTSKSSNYDSKLSPIIRLYNAYFGSGMASVVFQEMRESKALAYSVFSSFMYPEFKDDPYYNIAYIGTQADKITEAMQGMFDLLNDLPLEEKRFENVLSSSKQKVATQRIVRESILFNYLSSEKVGLDSDINEQVWEAYKSISINDLKKFHEDFIKNKSYFITILGSKDKIDTKKLEKFGKVKVLTLEEVFGY